MAANVQGNRPGPGPGPGSHSYPAGPGPGHPGPNDSSIYHCDGQTGKQREVVSLSCHFPQAFRSEYLRNNKSKGDKKLRCFVDCRPDGHCEGGFCGCPLKMVVCCMREHESLVKSGDIRFQGFLQAYEKGTGEVLLSEDDHDAVQVVYTGIFDRDPVSSHSSSGQSTLDSGSDGSSRIASIGITFNKNTRSWPYNWTGHRFREAVHAFVVQVWLVSSDPGTSGGVQDSGVQYLLGEVVSPAFSIACVRRGHTKPIDPTVTAPSFGVQTLSFSLCEDGNVMSVSLPATEPGSTTATATQMLLVAAPSQSASPGHAESMARGSGCDRSSSLAATTSTRTQTGARRNNVNPGDSDTDVVFTATNTGLEAQAPSRTGSRHSHCHGPGGVMLMQVRSTTTSSESTQGHGASKSMPLTLQGLTMGQSDQTSATAQDSSNFLNHPATVWQPCDEVTSASAPRQEDTELFRSLIIAQMMNVARSTLGKSRAEITGVASMTDSGTGSHGNSRQTFQLNVPSEPTVVAGNDNSLFPSRSRREESNSHGCEIYHDQTTTGGHSSPDTGATHWQWQLDAISAEPLTTKSTLIRSAGVASLCQPTSESSAAVVGSSNVGESNLLVSQGKRQCLRNVNSDSALLPPNQASSLVTNQWHGNSSTSFSGGDLPRSLMASNWQQTSDCYDERDSAMVSTRADSEDAIRPDYHFYDSFDRREEDDRGGALKSATSILTNAGKTNCNTMHADCAAANGPSLAAVAEQLLFVRNSMSPLAHRDVIVMTAPSDFESGYRNQRNSNECPKLSDLHDEYESDNPSQRPQHESLVNKVVHSCHQPDLGENVASSNVALALDLSLPTTAGSDTADIETEAKTDADSFLELDTLSIMPVPLTAVDTSLSLSPGLLGALADSESEPLTDFDTAIASFGAFPAHLQYQPQSQRLGEHSTSSGPLAASRTANGSHSNGRESTGSDLDTESWRNYTDIGPAFALAREHRQGIQAIAAASASGMHRFDVLQAFSTVRECTVAADHWGGRSAELLRSVNNTNTQAKAIAPEPLNGGQTEQQKQYMDLVKALLAHALPLQT